ncbi:hypothetical protein CTAM01_07398 [Colletotrichum tamarilloi]|uniref:Uncharacterized protein n=1 Tax=Colletotrichum tamarilloi TaxID=1209934 RepID=A0ABQ9R8N8_9PEZI|nr:uncharacterized protein CTAM01_07398 [Colletotrichum tamarilloi]KAK1498180.1 hypothetical protein CTAM01_07398 [Colletotrichum tamarilloi]
MTWARNSQKNDINGDSKQRVVSAEVAPRTSTELKLKLQLPSTLSSSSRGWGPSSRRERWWGDVCRIDTWRGVSGPPVNRGCQAYCGTLAMNQLLLDLGEEPAGFRTASGFTARLAGPVIHTPCRLTDDVLVSIFVWLLRDSIVITNAVGAANDRAISGLVDQTSESREKAGRSKPVARGHRHWLR